MGEDWVIAYPGQFSFLTSVIDPVTGVPLTPGVDEVQQNQSHFIGTQKWLVQFFGLESSAGQKSIMSEHKNEREGARAIGLRSKYLSCEELSYSWHDGIYQSSAAKSKIPEN